jgi:hypothetical protein
MRIRIVIVVAATLLLVSAFAYCQRGSAPGATGTPTPTVHQGTPPPEATATATPTPTPTPIPLTSAEVLSASLKALSELDTYRFSFSLTGPGRISSGGSGIWVAPGDYRLTVEQALCPPPVPGGTAPTGCALVPVYDAYRLEGRTHGNLLGAGWEEGGLAARYGLAFLDTPLSPARMLLELASAVGGLSVEHGAAGGMRLASGDGSVAVSVDLASLWPVEASVSDGTDRWEWQFTAHGDPLVIDAVARQE